MPEILHPYKDNNLQVKETQTRNTHNHNRKKEHFTYKLGTTIRMQLTVRSK